MTKRISATYHDWMTKLYCELTQAYQRPCLAQGQLSGNDRSRKSRLKLFEDIKSHPSAVACNSRVQGTEIVNGLTRDPMCRLLALLRKWMGCHEQTLAQNWRMCDRMSKGWQVKARKAARRE